MGDTTYILFCRAVDKTRNMEHSGKSWDMDKNNKNFQKKACLKKSKNIKIT